MNVFCKLSIIFFTLFGETKPSNIGQTGCPYDKKLKAYTSVDKLPEYPGGMSAYGRFFINNFKANDTIKFQSNIRVAFVVLLNGSLSKLTIPQKSKKEYTTFDKEALRVLKLMPKWKPGTCNGKVVPVYMQMPRVILEPQG